MTSWLVAVLFVVVFIQATPCPFSSKFNKLATKEADCPHMKAQAFARPADTTVNGCTCKSNCGASITDLYNCDWCYTLNGCGSTGISGSYDYCVYPANKQYEYQTWDKKLSYLWSQIDADHTSGVAGSPLNLLKTSVQTSFDSVSDEMPAGREKWIHGIGAVCKFSMQINASSPFTGVWKANNVAHGLVRMGSAIPVTTSSGVVPGLGIKFLRSNVPSGNFVALYTLSPLPDNSYNFFERPFSNHIPAATGATAVLAKKFFQKSNCVTQVGLSDICAYDNEGRSTGVTKFPFQVILESKKVQFPKTPVTHAQLQQELAAIPSGTPLFQVSYFTDPKQAKSGMKPMVLGTMVTDGPCVNSKYGDATLFFRHQLIEEDWQQQPTWPGYLDATVDCSSSGHQVQTTPPYQCPEPSRVDFLRSPIARPSAVKVDTMSESPDAVA